MDYIDETKIYCLENFVALLQVALTREENNKMKKLKTLILGDSISLGYRNFVRQMLNEKVNVIYPPENGRSISYTFRSLYEWSRDLRWSNDIDLVYWNNGLWDVVHIFDDETHTPLPVYAQYIECTFNRLKYMFPKAKIVFATSTPVLEDEYDKNVFYRNNGEIQIYNQIATQVILNKGGTVHDLYTLIANSRGGVLKTHNFIKMPLISLDQYMRLWQKKFQC